jgi:hypothetical protein
MFIRLLVQVEIDANYIKKLNSNVNKIIDTLFIQFSIKHKNMLSQTVVKQKARRIQIDGNYFFISFLC